MKVRHLCAVAGISLAVGAVVFMQSLVATNDHQSLAVAERLLKSVPVAADSRTAALQLDFRPDGRVLQGPPMMAMLAVDTASRLSANEAVVTRALFAQRRVKRLPKIGDELTFVGRKGAYRLKIAGYLDWDRPMRGYPNVLVSRAAAKAIDEEWRPWAVKSAADLAPMFKSDAGHHFDRSKPLLLWAAALTALCLLLNSLFLSIEARRKEIATLRMLGMTRGGVVRLVLGEALWLTLGGLFLGVVGSLVALYLYVAADAETFPLGMAVGTKGILVSALLSPVVALLGVLLSLRSALSVRPLEAASNRTPVKRQLGMLIAFAFGFGAFVAVEVWGASLTKPFIPSKEWPDAIVSILPNGVSSFDIEKLGNLPGVRRVSELQPLQVNFHPLESVGKGERGGFRNALLLASDRLPAFRFVEGSHDAAAAELTKGDNCVITEMMARARKCHLGDKIELDCGRGLVIALKIVGVVDLNWHLVTSRGLVRGLNRMPGSTDGPLFVSFDTLMACDNRPQEFVKMTHLWLDFEPEFLSKHGVFPAGRLVEDSIRCALDGAKNNTVRLHSRDEVADGTLAHGTDLVGAMARVPYLFLIVVSLGFIAMLVASADSRQREFRVLRAVGATRRQIARVLIDEALWVAAKAIILGLLGGALIGWLFTSGTRAAMANWGLPACFDLPIVVIVKGALGAILFTLLVAVPTSIAIIRPRK